MANNNLSTDISIRRSIWINPNGDNGWIVFLKATFHKGPDSEKVPLNLEPIPLFIEGTKKEAVARAVRVQEAISVSSNDLIELYIRKQDGSIQDRRTYPKSADPKGNG